jgi:hypothetical protein
VTSRCRLGILAAHKFGAIEGGSPSYLRPGTPALAKFLIDRGYNTGKFGKNHLGDHIAALPTAHGFQEYWGYLYHLDAMREVSFLDINASPTVQGIAPPFRNTPIPGIPEVPVGGPQNDDLPDTPFAKLQKKFDLHCTLADLCD